MLTHVGMASLVTLFNRLFFAIAGETDIEAALMLLADTVQAFRTRSLHNQSEVQQKASGLIPSEITLFTHSFSETVLNAVILAAGAGRHPHVICTESQPQNAGRHLAAQLAAAGIQTSFVVDAAVYAALKSCDLVFIGTQSITEEGVLARVGTANLAVAAQVLSVPCYVLADTGKIWASALGGPPLFSQAAREVWASPPQGVEIYNPTFDLSPWRAISGVVTEGGLMMPEDIIARSRSMPVHPTMQVVIAKVRARI